MVIVVFRSRAAILRIPIQSVPCQGDAIAQPIRSGGPAVTEVCLDEQVAVQFQDLRDIDKRDGQSDKISSVRMFEHVSDRFEGRSKSIRQMVDETIYSV